MDEYTQITHKDIEYKISNIEINRGLEKNLDEDLEFNCNESLKGFRMKFGMYRELAKVNIMMAFQGDKAPYHIETLLTHAVINNVTADLYEKTYKHLLE